MSSRAFRGSLDYRPLSSRGQIEIRLLEVRPAKTVDQPLQGRLIHVPVTEDINYVGLSLLYGDIATSEVIHVDGHALQVPSSIGEASRNMRSTFTHDKINLFSSTKGTGTGMLPALSKWASFSSTPSTGAYSAACETIRSTDSSSQSARPHRQRAKSWSRATMWLRNTFRSGRSKRAAGGEEAKITVQTDSPQPLRIWLDALCIDSQNADEMKHRRSTTALAYRGARLVVGWLGPKDDEANLAISFMVTLSDAAPPLFGDSRHRLHHPEHYGPFMNFLAPLEQMWEVAPGARAEDHPAYLALKSFLGRPYFCNNWILEELAFSRNPGILVGDTCVSWLQILRFICICEELVEKGSGHFPDEYRHLLNYLQLGSLYIFLEEYDRRRAAQFALEERDDMRFKNDDRAPEISEARNTTSSCRQRGYVL